jgi:hypothetical protein
MVQPSSRTTFTDLVTVVVQVAATPGESTDYED